MNSSQPTSIPALDVPSRLPAALLLDVRTPAEFRESHIQGAVLHPITELNPDFVRTQLGGDRECIIVCGSGGRARKAADSLCAAGLSHIKILEGGMKAWTSHGLPTIDGAKTVSLERQVRISAGSLVLLGALLGYFVNPAWIALSGFIGAGLVFSGVTDTCGMALMLARMPWNTKGCGCSSSKASCATK